MNAPTRKIARAIKAITEMSAPSRWYTILATKVGENMSAAAITTSKASRMPRCFVRSVVNYFHPLGFSTC